VSGKRLNVGNYLSADMLRFGSMFVRWSVENFAYAQLLFWRPVPGFRPSASAYEPAVDLYEHSLSWLTHLQQRGLIRADVDVAAVQRDWTVLISGVISQQLANAPDETFEAGRFTAALPNLVAMLATHYAQPARGRPSQRAAASGRRGAGRRRRER
jgi:hypothetical protein